MSEGRSHRLLWPAFWRRVRAWRHQARQWWSRLPFALAGLWSERNAAARALAPAWPVLVMAVAAAAGLSATDQGREAVIISAVVEPYPLSATLAQLFDPRLETTPEALSAARALVFVCVTGLFSLLMMLAAIYAMSIRRRPAAADTPTALAAARVRPDPIHTSVNLRVRTAMALGLIAPAAILYTLAPSILWGALVGGVAAAAPARLVEDLIHRCDLGLQEGLRKRQAFVELTRRRCGGGRSFQDLLALIRWGWAETLRALFRLVRFGFDLVRWLTQPKAIWIAGAAAGGLIAVGGLTTRDPAGFEVTAVGLVIATTLAALVFLRARDTTMREVGARDSRHLVVDRRVQTKLRGLFSLVTLGVFGLFWLCHVHPPLTRLLGPAAATLLGLFATTSLLLWFVRMAMSAAPVDRPPDPVARPGPGLGTRFLTAFFFGAGRVVEHLQGVFTAHRVFGLGVGVFVFDAVTEAFSAAPPLWLQVMSLTAPAGGGVAFAAWGLGDRFSETGTVIAAGVFMIGAAVAYGVSAAFAAFALGRGGAARPEDAPRLLRATFAPRMPSAVLLAPFLLASLGQDYGPPLVHGAPRGGDGGARPQAMSLATPTTPPPLVEEHAAAWLATAAARADRRGPGSPIPAVIVLAEGGGVRAAVQVATLLAALDGRRGDDDLFADVFALSGVSGGSVGSAVYLATRAEDAASGRCSAAGVQAVVQEALAQDQLTPLVAGMFGSDLLSIMAPLGAHERWREALDAIRPQEADISAPLLPGRADFFETALSQAFRRAHSIAGTPAERDWLAAPLETAALAATGCEDGAAAPVVLFSTFAADQRLQAVASNVAFPATCFEAQPGQLIDVRSCLVGHSPDYVTLPMGAAAHLSARFPGSNPPAILEGWSDGKRRRVRFVDGAYFDNSGAAAASVALSALQEAAAELGLQDRLRVVVLHVFVREQQGETGGAGATSRHPFNEFTGPLAAVWSARETSALAPVAGLCRQVTRRPGPEADQACASLAGLRVVTPETPASAIVTQVWRASGGRTAWISAGIDNARNQTEDDYLLLGWLMRSASHRHIAEKNETLAPLIREAVRAMTARDGPEGPVSEP